VSAVSNKIATFRILAVVIFCLDVVSNVRHYTSPVRNPNGVLHFFTEFIELFRLGDIYARRLSVSRSRPDSVELGNAV
jgi:hypothetical protein